MSLLNRFQCYVENGNTGRGGCDKEPGLEIGGYITPYNFQLPSSAMESVDAFRLALAAAINADDPRDRIYPIKDYETITDKGEASVYETLGYGKKVKVRGETLADEFVILSGKCYHDKISNFEGPQRGYLGVDENYTIWGTRRKDPTTGKFTLGALHLSSLDVSKYKKRNGQNSGQFSIGVYYANRKEVDRDFAYFDMDVNPLAEINGLFDVDLVLTSPTAVTIQVAASWNCDSEDLHDVFPTQLAQVGAFSVKNAEPGDTHYGNDITYTIASNGIGWLITLAATGTDPDNPGTGKKVSVKLGALSTLAVLTTPVEGLESKKVTVSLA